MKLCDFFPDTCVMSARPRRRAAAVAAADLVQQQAQDQPACQGPRGRGGGGNRGGLREPPRIDADLEVT